MRWFPGRLAVLVLAAVDLAVFGALAGAVVVSPSVTLVDRAVNASLAAGRQEPWLSIFLWITTLGTGATLIAVTTAATVLLWARRSGVAAGCLWFTFLATEAMTWATKYAVGRHRPNFIGAASASSASFPSAHAAGSTAVYGLLALIVARELRSPAARRAAAAIVIALLSAVGFSRIFLSVHYLSDVLGGFLVGGFWLIVVSLWLRVRDTSPRGAASRQ